MVENCKIGVLGAGNMGGALVAGLVRAGRIPPEHITAVDKFEPVLQPLRQLGVHTDVELSAAVRDMDVVVIGLKPQDGVPLLGELASLLSSDQVLVSIMAGVDTAQLEEQLNGPCPVVRVMPQTLARLGGAASGACPGRHATQKHLDLVRAIFDQVGSTVVVKESQMDAVTGLSGSGPAYVYTVIEALTDGGVRVGLPRDVARTLAAQTVLGAAAMVLESGLHPAELRDQVTSPGGTTIAGLHALEDKGLRAALMDAVRAAAERSAELGAS